MSPVRAFSLFSQRQNQLVLVRWLCHPIFIFSLLVLLPCSVSLHSTCHPHRGTQAPWGQGYLPFFPLSVLCITLRVEVHTTRIVGMQKMFFRWVWIKNDKSLNRNKHNLYLDMRGLETLRHRDGRRDWGFRGFVARDKVTNQDRGARPGVHSQLERTCRPYTFETNGDENSVRHGGEVQGHRRGAFDLENITSFL